MTRLLVPISLDALVVRPGEAPQPAATAWTSPTRPASGSPVRQSLAPIPFEDVPVPRPVGVHLHWAVPDALAILDSATGSFPPLPCRWLVVRLDGLATAATPRRMTTWLLPNIHADAPAVLPDGALTVQPVGAASAPVTIRGRGADGPHPSWALGYDDTAGRLSFHDPVDPTAVTGPLAYLVVGWYTHTRFDPLVPPEGTPATPTWFLDVLAQHRWAVTAPAGGPVPTGSLYHGSAVGIGWPGVGWPGDDGGTLSTPVGGLPDPTTLTSALGDNLVAAVAALLDSGAGAGVDAQTSALSEAILTGGARVLDQPDGAARLDATRHQSRFLGVAPQAGVADAIYEEVAPTSAPAVAAAVASAVASPVPIAVRSGLTDLTTAALHLMRPDRIRNPPAVPAGGGSGPPPPAAVAAAGATDPGGRITEVTYPTPRLWQAGDPVIAVANLGRTLRHGGDGRFNPAGLLDCRLTEQTVWSNAPRVLPTWAPAADVPGEVTDLLTELACLDPGSAVDLATGGARSAVAAARVSWWATWSGDWRSVPLTTDWQGLLPSPIAVTRPSRPWNPLRLDWEVQWTPTPTGPSHWELGDLDFEPVEPFDLTGATGVTLTGSGWLSPAPAALLQGATTTAGLPAGSAVALADAVAASFEGFLDRIRGVPKGSWVGPRGIVDVPPQLLLDAEPYVATGHTAGVWRLTRLRAVDTYGQALDLRWPAGGPAPAPAVPDDLTVAGVDGLLLRPRFTAPATMSARFLLGEPASDIEAGPGHSPLAGFLLPSPVGTSVELVDPSGVSRGELRPDPRSLRTTVQDTPGADGRPLDGVLGGLADLLTGADRATQPAGIRDSALGTLLDVLATTRATVDATGRAGDGQLGMFLGNPVAVLRLGITLTVADPQGAASNAGVLTPVRLGSLGLLTDGILAWYLEDDPTTLHPIHDAVVDALGAGEDWRLGRGRAAPALLGPPLVWLTPGVQRTLVVLAVPAADLTVVSGLLPQKRLEVVREWTDLPLRVLTPTFGYDAVIRDPAAIALPVPPGVRGTWTWFQRPEPGRPWAGDPLSTDPPSAQPGTPVLAQDGYLRVSLIDDAPYRSAEFVVSCITRGGPTGSIQFVGGANSDGSRWRLPVGKAVEMIDSGRFSFAIHSVVGGVERTVPLRIAVSHRGRKYLRTPADETTLDNLEELPQCP